jgi:small subunit ribosomal protein S18
LAEEMLEPIGQPEGAGEQRPAEERGAARAQQRRYFPRKRVCAFCVDKVKIIDYKDVATLQRYVTDQGRIRGRKQTGTCARHQHQLSRAIKRARQLALMPYCFRHEFVS